MATVLGACANRRAATVAPTAQARSVQAVPGPDGGGDEALEAGTPEEAPSRLFGSGEVELELWYQDEDGLDHLLQGVGSQYSDGHEDVTLNLRPMAYADLYVTLLPAIAAGDEGDIVMMYTNWIADKDIERLFADMTEALGGFSQVSGSFWEASLKVIDTPEDRVFYLPWLAGLRGATITVNRDHLAEKGIDYFDFRAWEEVIEAGILLTRRSADGAMVRAGYSINASQCSLLYNIIWGLGGRMYDRATARWSWHTSEGIEGVRRLSAVYWEHQTSSHELYATEFQGVRDGLISMWGDGAWTASAQEQTAGVPADNVVVPRIADGVTDDLYPGHVTGWAVSRRLLGSQQRLGAAVDLLTTILGPEALVPYFDAYSSVCASMDVYDDPGIDNVKYGAMSRRVATAVWPRARYNRDHVVDIGPASEQLDRALRNEISAEEALRAMDVYCQQAESVARESMGQRST